MLKRFFALFFAITFSFISGMVSPAFADDLSQGLELYHAKKYKEAIPYLERAANDGHEKAIEALDQIYGSQEKGQANNLKPASDKANPDSKAAKDGKNQVKQENANAGENKDATVPDAEKKEDSKSSFWRKVIAIFFAIGIVIIWFIHHTILRRKREQLKNKNPFQ